MAARITVDDANQRLRASPFGPWWGFEAIDVHERVATLRLPVQPHHYRPGGVLQGGCCMTLADVAVWIAMMTVEGVDDPAVTLEMKTNFLGAATGDLACTARVVTNGRRVAFATADTTRPDGRIVAHHTVTYLR